MRHLKKNTINYSELDDQELVRIYRKNGDERAFSVLLKRHKAKIYSYIYSMVGRADVANDIFQETFTKVITKLDDTYNEQGKWIAWVMRIAHNATIDYIRKQKRFVDVNSNSTDDSYDFYERLPDDKLIDAETRLEKDEAKDSLMKHIANLPDEQRQVVMLRHYYEMSFKEIAELTNVSINTALGRMRYALINLRKMFEQENGDEVKYAKR
ncbi:MAG TPA: sigma-70 family RNA polymerase sigma factor [Balneolales bacterium]|nr:sigma-70 family RNA polymerase sigma factor [Balneolales bacterium]